MSAGNEEPNECGLCDEDAGGDPNLCCCYVIDEQGALEAACPNPVENRCCCWPADRNLTARPSALVSQGSSRRISKRGGMMIDVDKKAKRCCTTEHTRLVERLDACDDRARTHAERRRCYRAAARTSGRRSRKCIAGG